MTPTTEFRILHISDLHFGAHNVQLESTLKSSVEQLRPHLIIATGDLADRPSKKRLLEAKATLARLEAVCVASASKRSPRLIVTPGNHDKMFLGNLMVLRNPFGTVFKGAATNFYYPEDRIWVYAMDSARPRIFGANGFVPDQEIAAFAVEHKRLQSDHPGVFPEHVFKIIALHHHPLPVNESSNKADLQRWLTLMNAGALLGAALTHEVDLILHGHEHIDAQSTFRSSFGGKRDVHVVSVGATLRSGEANYMNLVRIGPDREVHVDSYKTATTVFPENPTRHPIRTLREARDRKFDAEAASRGYNYREIASITILNADGDCRRIIECDGLSIQKPEQARPHLSRIQLCCQTCGSLRIPTRHLSWTWGT